MALLGGCRRTDVAGYLDEAGNRHATRVVARHSSDPTERHWQAVAWSPFVEAMVLELRSQLVVVWTEGVDRTPSQIKIITFSISAYTS